MEGESCGIGGQERSRRSGGESVHFEIKEVGAGGDGTCLSDFINFFKMEIEISRTSKSHDPAKARVGRFLQRSLEYRRLCCRGKRMQFILASVIVLHSCAKSQITPRRQKNPASMAVSSLFQQGHDVQRSSVHPRKIDSTQLTRKRQKDVARLAGTPRDAVHLAFETHKSVMHVTGHVSGDTSLGGINTRTLRRKLVTVRPPSPSAHHDQPRSSPDARPVKAPLLYSLAHFLRHPRPHLSLSSGCQG